ncbi:MAG: enoyl-ACP reductase [Cytophagales bacterium CG12_big_fil_rev_8_21_14_0_65_40_12]|nr:MAG: enoyl-ACP reductase [Cytophagales bacterium CG12_big_fil_rev_8_21_14_0_65_40_12]PIW03555.1 MAG: enoyl-ACP reductase [Cytophagales bacterium CG17_big_fil_post_rev_8_21_14_2_50_40_13]
MAHNLLKGKRGIIFGALDERSIAWKVAQVAKAEGAVFTLTNAPIAMRMGEINKLAAECGSEVIAADATSIEDLENLFTKSMEILGGKIDFVLHSIGMSPNVRKGRDYGDLNYDWLMKTLDVSAISFHKVMQTAEKLDAMNEWGSIMGLSYIAAQRTFPDYSDMAHAKAMLESIARSYGERFARLKKVRVNTISQSPTMTTAGTGVGGFDVFYDYADKLSPLGNASALDCANYCAVMFSDMTKMVTMQNLMHDGGFSTSGMTDALVEQLKKD